MADYTKVRLTNGIFDHWYVTNDATSPYSSDIPTEWDLLTIMDANFNGNLRAGNLDAELLTVDGFRIKRRKTDEFDWVTIRCINKADIDDFSFIINDNLAENMAEYEYAIVPVSGGVEGNYISDTISTKFNGVFICDADTIYRFYAGVQYDTQDRVQKVGVFEPYGRKYPVVVSNGLIGYTTGAISGTVLPNDYLQTKNLDRKAMVKERKQLNDFLTNKKAKIIKDWNGNIWLVAIIGNPSTSYAPSSGMGIADVKATWVEVGDPNVEKDLISTGMIREV